MSKLHRFPLVPFTLKSNGAELHTRYWGCTKPLTGIPGESVQTVTTASVMVTGSRSWKAYLENPWDSPLCPSTSSVASGSKWLGQGTRSGLANPRTCPHLSHSCISYWQRWLPCNNSGIGRRNFVSECRASRATLYATTNRLPSTSPSIYAAFSNIGAYDSCGAEVISTTMLSFAPGELSTVVGPRYLGNIAATTLPFDFADLVSEEPNLLMSYSKNGKYQQRN